MTDLDQNFCMRYFLCILQAASNFFVYSDPLKKVVLSEVGAFFQKCCMYLQLFGMLFFPLQTRNLSSMPEMLYVQHFWHAITNHILILCKRSNLAPGGGVLLQYYVTNSIISYKRYSTSSGIYIFLTQN